MISKETIISSFDDKETLLKWLKKVESALTGATLTNLVMTKLSDVNHVGTYQITATFADSTSVVSDTFTLPSVDIVTAFGNLTTLVNGFNNRITTNEGNISGILDIVDIANDKIDAYTLQNSINGSDDVIVDVDENNDKLEIHLSAELQAKLARVLLLPLSTPSTRKVVTIDTNGAQDNVDGTELTTLMDNIVDSDGHKRFQEWDISNLGTGLDITYSKITLSGSHLMAVVSGRNNTDNAITLPDYMFSATLPTWLLQKLYSPEGTFGNERDISAQDLKVFSSLWEEATSYLTVVHISPSSHSFIIRRATVISVPANSYIRLQVDLIID